MIVGLGSGIGFSGRLSPVLWVPSDLGVKLEVDWNVASATVSGGNVVSIPDDAGKGHSISQGTAGNRPQYVAAKFGALPGAYTDSAKGLDVSGTLLSGAAAHMFWVVKYNYPGTGLGINNPWCLGTAGDNDHYPYTAQQVYSGFASDTRRDCGISPVDLSDGAAHCFESISAAGRFVVRIDGTDMYVSASNTVAWAATQSVCWHYAWSGYGVIGWHARWLMANQELTGADLTNMRAYITRLYGVTFS